MGDFSSSSFALMNSLILIIEKRNNKEYQETQKQEKFFKRKNQNFIHKITQFLLLNYTDLNLIYRILYMTNPNQTITAMILSKKNLKNNKTSK